MFHPEDAIRIYTHLLEQGIQVWLTGGWGIDALLGEQTRPHKDLDVIMLLDDVLPMRQLLARQGFGLKEIWEENRWVSAEDGSQLPTAFVLEDAGGRQIDAHAVRLDARGDGIPAWEDTEGLLFTRQALAGEGSIQGVAVRCLTPAMQLICHTGYSLPEKQVQDLARLREKFDVTSAQE